MISQYFLKFFLSFHLQTYVLFYVKSGFPTKVGCYMFDAQSLMIWYDSFKYSYCHSFHTFMILVTHPPLSSQMEVDGNNSE